MPKITYLFGAGASATALPLVKSDIDHNIEGLPDAFRRVGEQIMKDFQDPKLIDPATKLKNDLEWLAERSEKFNTVDTFAKYCYLKKREDLQKVKKILSAYFTIDQIINKKTDNRYLVFLTSILESSYQFPDNIKILNWNYDNQFQIASNMFTVEAIEFPKPDTFIQSDSLIPYYPSIGMFTSPHASEYEKYSLVHLNGIAGYYKNSEGYTLNLIKESLSIQDFLKNSIEAINENQHFISFGWEEAPIKKESESINLSKTIIAGSEILVVIGYSFPFFNRQVDKEIINQLVSTGLKKIYYQDRFRNGEFLYSQFNLKKPLEIENYDKVDQFLIPSEL